MQLLLLIAGIVLLLAGPWFAGQVAVGWALIVIFVVITVIQIAFLGLFAKKTHDIHKRF